MPRSPKTVWVALDNKQKAILANNPDNLRVLGDGLIQATGPTLGFRPTSAPTWRSGRECWTHISSA
jgi:hypothetical protein